MRAEQKKLSVLGVLLIAAGVLLPAGPAVGAITATGDITPAYDGVSIPWTILDDLFVGNTADANLVITNGSRVSDVDAFIAREASSTASVLVTGANSKWVHSDDLFIGGTQTLAGGTATLTISDGGLVDATDDAFIRVGGTLTGNGTLKADSLTNYGTIKPGNSIGTLTIDGDVTFWVNSILEVEVDNSGHSDKLVVIGDVNIVGGTVRAISTETITGNQQYTIIDANGVTGRFDTLNTALLTVTMMDPNSYLGYTADSVLLNIAATPFDLNIGRTPNQCAVGTALQRIAEAGGRPVTSLVQQLPSLDAVRASYDQLSGQSRPPLAPIAMTDSAKFMGIVSNRLQAARGTMARDLDGLSDGPLLAMAEPDTSIGAGSSSSWDGFLWDLPSSSSQDWGIWAKMYGLSGDRKTAGGTPGYSYSVYGQSFGIDRQLDERLIGGVMGGASKSEVDYDGLTDDATIDAVHAGLYSNYSGNGWYANSMVMYSILNLDTKRVVALTGEQHEGSFDGHEWSGYIEGGIDLQPAVTWLVQPLVAFQASLLRLDPYAETGLLTALAYSGQDYESYRASVGAKVSKELALDLLGGAAILQARGRWVHEFGDVLSTVDARFEEAPLVRWKVRDEEVSRDSILLGAGAGIRISRSLRAFVDYDTSFNSDKTVNVISGALEYRW